MSAPAEYDTIACVTCAKRVGPNDRQHYDFVNGETACESCAPSYEDMQREPAAFVDYDGDPLDAEQVAGIIADHLAAGGSITDKLVS